MIALGRLGAPFVTALVLVAAAVAAHGLSLLARRRLLDRLATLLFLGAAGATVWILVARYLDAGRPPFKTLYESLVLFAASVALLYAVVERFYRLALLGLLASAFVLAILGYAAVKADVDTIALPAALQSAWFVPHVVVYFLGYAALFLAAALAAVHLARPGATVTFSNLGGSRVVGYGELMHTVTKFGFASISVGLVIGALWAKSAWGDYWVWDPKENWSLITWLIYVIYLHLRRSPGWTERRSAGVLIAGFAAVMFTYLGVSLLPTAGQSAHVYQ
ncbi:MAG: cytochrome c biogenesis protein CcsA [Deltaproteobacteria bacterium]|nr:cytochrome c biogenesis protein CcsA [Deltaproteobacteria bacterium]